MALKLRKMLGTQKQPAKPRRKRTPIFWLEVRSMIPLYHNDIYPPDIIIDLIRLQQADERVSLTTRMLTQDQKLQEDQAEDQRRALEWEELVHELNRPENLGTPCLFAQHR